MPKSLQSGIMMYANLWRRGTLAATPDYAGRDLGRMPVPPDGQGLSRSRTKFGTELKLKGRRHKWRQIDNKAVTCSSF
jgi:hypothetical protein